MALLTSRLLGLWLFLAPLLSKLGLLLLLQAMVDVAVFPDVLSYFAVRVLVVSLTVSDVVSELAFVDFTIFPKELAPAVLHVVGVLAFELVAVVRFPYSFALSLSVGEFTLVDTPVLPFVGAWTMEFTL